MTNPNLPRAGLRSAGSGGTVDCHSAKEQHNPEELLLLGAHCVCCFCFNQGCKVTPGRVATHPWAPVTSAGSEERLGPPATGTSGSYCPSCC